MSKISKKDIQKTVNSNESIDYEKLRLDVLKGLIEIRNIECKQTKEEMVKYLKMEDQGKYFRPVTYQKQPDGKFIVGIDIGDSDNCREMGKLVEKGIAENLRLYYDNRVHFISNQKLI